jgi:hypothetical protein
MKLVASTSARAKMFRKTTKDGVRQRNFVALVSGCAHDRTAASRTWQLGLQLGNRDIQSVNSVNETNNAGSGRYGASGNLDE